MISAPRPSAPLSLASTVFLTLAMVTSPARADEAAGGVYGVADGFTAGLAPLRGFDGQSFAAPSVVRLPLAGGWDATLTHNAVAAAGARGSYLDIGVRHDLGHAARLTLHAGDGHAVGVAGGMWDWRDMKAGLSRKLEGGWVLALNYTRAFGALPYDRAVAASAASRFDERPAYVDTARRALVLSMARRF